jgi:hypothetical protein
MDSEVSCTVDFRISLVGEIHCHLSYCIHFTILSPYITTNIPLHPTLQQPAQHIPASPCASALLSPSLYTTVERSSAHRCRVSPGSYSTPPRLSSATGFSRLFSSFPGASHNMGSGSVTSIQSIACMLFALLSLRMCIPQSRSPFSLRGSASLVEPLAQSPRRPLRDASHH